MLKKGSTWMETVHSLTELHETINNNQFCLVYISREDCSVCHGLLPQIEHALQSFPSVVSIRMDADAVPEIAGEYSIFTVPVVLVFVAGKEMIRKARFIPIEPFKAELSKLIKLAES